MTEKTVTMCPVKSRQPCIAGQPATPAIPCGNPALENGYCEKHQPFARLVAQSREK